METRFSLAHLTSIGSTHEELIRYGADAGYDLVSLRTMPMGMAAENPENDPAKNPGLLTRIKKALKETGMGLNDVELARISEGVNIEGYRQGLNTAAELGAKAVITNIWTEDKPYYIDKFGELCDLAQEFGLTVDLEIVTFAVVNNLIKAKETLMAAGRKNMGLLIDTWHFHCSRLSLDELEGLPPEWFHFIHLCDAPKEIPDTVEGLRASGRLYPGEGGIDIAGIINRIPCRTFSVEIPNRERVAEKGAEWHIRRCLETARDYITRQGKNA